MQRTDNTGKAKATGRQVGSSTTLNRKYVKRPGTSMDMVTAIDVKRSPKIQRFNTAGRVSIAKPITQEVEMEKPVVPEVDVQDASMYDSEMQGLDASAFGMQESIMEESVMQEPMMQQAEMEAQPEMVEQIEIETQPEMVERVESEEEMVVQPHPLQVTANKRVQARKSKVSTTSKLTAKELKDQAIQKALASASNVSSSSKAKEKAGILPAFKVGVGRVALALVCTTLAVLAIVYFVNMNMPDISLRVAAMQTGIKASYPSFVPRDYSITSITSEDKKISLDFKNGHTEEQFTLTEETSSWDSNALLTNYVKPQYHDNYSMIKEQGITIYVSGSNAVWVNGGVMYKINAEDGVLSNKQIRSIATSL